MIFFAVEVQRWCSSHEARKRSQRRSDEIRRGNEIVRINCSDVSGSEGADVARESVRESLRGLLLCFFAFSIFGFVVFSLSPVLLMALPRSLYAVRRSQTAEALA